MILSEITFLNKKRFLVDSHNLVNVNHIEQQNNKLRRTEFMVKKKFILYTCMQKKNN